MKPLDFSPLTATKTHSRLISQSYLTRRLSVSILFLLAGCLMILPFIPGLFKLLTLALIALGVIMLVVEYRPYERERLNNSRLQGFSVANGFAFRPTSTDTTSDDSGFVFTYQEPFGTNFKRDSGIVEGAYNSHDFKIGRHEYIITASAAQGNIGIEVYFFRIRLKEPSVQIILRGGAHARAIKRLGTNDVQAEGELYEHFKVSCIPGNESTIEKVLTPDLQHELLAISAPVDIEINGQYMYLYFKRDLLITQSLLEHFFKIIALL